LKNYRRFLCAAAAVIACTAAVACAEDRAAAPAALRTPDVRYEPSDPEVVQVMLGLAGVSAGDVVYDLGCGDGRIVINAARQARARGVCVDIDPRRISESRENARAAGVSDRVEFRNQDLLTTEIGGATVVMLFLSPELNLKVRARLLRELKPGTRIVSHWHDMGDWKPQESVFVQSGGRGRYVYLWTIPERQ
jgi:predicted O-methyltransferase YrrM